MSKGRRRAPNKKSDNKPKNQSDAVIKKRPRKDRQTNCRKAYSKIYEDKENVDNSRKKLTSERITMPLGFFSQGVKSKTVQKNAKTYALNQESCNFLNEDLHALLQNAPDTECDKGSQQTAGRSSNHMVTRSQTSQKQYKTVTDYYMKIDSSHDCKENTLPPQTQPAVEESKSMFKEIDKCYSKFIAEQKLQKNAPEKPKDEISYPTPSHFEHKLNNRISYFCKNLKEQLPSIPLPSRKAQCLKRIKVAISNINDNLEGKEVQHSPEIKPEAVMHDNFLPVMQHLIPKSSWLYETPSDKTLKRPLIHNYNKLKPAIYQPNAKVCKPLFNLSSNTASPKFFESANYTFTKAIQSANKNQLSNNLMFEYPEDIAFTAQSNTDEFLHENKENFLFSSTGNMFEDDKRFQNIQTPDNINNLMFNQNCNNPSKQSHQDIPTPDCLYLLPVKRQRSHYEELPANFLENYNDTMIAASNVVNENILFNSKRMSSSKKDCSLEYNKCFKRNSQLEILINHPRCSKIRQDVNTVNNEEFLSSHQKCQFWNTPIKCTTFYSKKPIF